MDRTAGPALRWARAGVLAAVASGSGAVAHVSAGGLLPGRPSLILLFVVCLVPAACLLGRPASTLRVTLLLVAGQSFIHWALMAAAGHPGHPPMRHVDPTGPPGVMTLAHLGAAVLVGLWLAQGERVLWTVFSLAVGGVQEALGRRLVAHRGTLALVRALVADLIVLRRSRPGAAAPDRLPPRDRMLRRSVVRRGPPALLPA